MVEPTHVLSVEGDILRHCAFNIPAVAYTVGRKYWPILKPTYLELANDMQWKVRRTLAFSIHKLAAILGPEITEQDLLPVFVGFLRDLDEVRIGILQHLYDFMKVRALDKCILVVMTLFCFNYRVALLNKNACRTLLGNLADFLQSDNVRDWRFRHLFAQQLIPLCVLYDIEDVNEYISPIAMTLAIDRVAEVRRITFRLVTILLIFPSCLYCSTMVGMIFKCFYNAEKLAGKSFPITDNFSLDIVKSFAKSHRWSRRQTYAIYFLLLSQGKKALAAQ
uniref:PPP4R1 n=1 Tax=Soboliphyme baturini TaxID=241478 RepID=A0A183IH74_9BILA